MKDLKDRTQSNKVSVGEAEKELKQSSENKTAQPGKRSALERFRNTPSRSEQASDQIASVQDGNAEQEAHPNESGKGSGNPSWDNASKEPETAFNEPPGQGSASGTESGPAEKTKSGADRNGRPGRSSDSSGTGRGSGNRRSGSILRLNHPEYTSEKSGSEASGADIKTPENGGKTKVDAPKDESKISASQHEKSAKIKVGQEDSGKISTASASPKTGKILALNGRKITSERLGKIRGGAAGEAVKQGSLRKQGGGLGASAGAGKGPVAIIALPAAIIVILHVVILLVGILLPLIFVILLSSLLPKNPYDKGVDMMTYLVTKYHGDESRNMSLTGGFGTFEFKKDEDIMSLVDYLYSKCNEDGEYDSLKKYTSENRSEYSRIEKTALHAVWVSINLLHGSKLLQDQQRYMIDTYYLPEEERIEEEYDISLDGASYALKSVILSLTFMHPKESERDAFYEDIDWLGDSEDEIIEDLYEGAIDLLDEEEEDENLVEKLLKKQKIKKQKKAWEEERRDAVNLFDGILDIYKNARNSHGDISWSDHDKFIFGILDLGMDPVDNLKLSPENPTGIVSRSAPSGGQGTAYGGLATSEIFGPVTGGGYYLDVRMQYLFPNGVPNSQQEMSQYLVTVPCETCNRGVIYVTVHRLLAEKVQQAFHEMAEIGFPINGNTYGYGWRDAVTVTSSGQTFRSHHSYGVVVDLNSDANYMVKNGQVLAGSHWLPGEDPYSVTQEVVEIWKNQGFLWGGEFPDSRDYMHFTFTGH